MKKNSKFVAGIIASIALTTTIVACSSGGGGGGGTPALTETEALGVAATSLASFGNAGVSASSAFFKSVSNVSAYSQPTDVICDSNGDTKVSGNTGAWAFSHFLCAGAHNTYSPDSALGALYLMKGIVCTAASQGVQYAVGGGTKVTFNNVALTAACFSQAMIDKFAGETQPVTHVSGEVTGYTLENSAWDTKLEFRNSTVGDFDIFVRKSGNVIAAAFESTSGGDSWSVTVDRSSTPQYVAYEVSNQHRHMRLMAEGVINTDGTVESVTSMAGIGASDGMNKYVAIRGSEADGLRINFYNTSEVLDACYDVGGNGATCAGVTALSFIQSDITGFVGSSSYSAIDALIGTNPLSMSVSSFPVSNAPADAYDNPLR